MWDDQGISEEDLSLVREIDELQPGGENAERLWALADSGTVLVAHRSLERLKDISSLVETDRLYDWIKDGKLPEEKRIRALDVLAVWIRSEREEHGESERYRRGVEALKNCFYDRNPYFSKGTVVALGIAGGHDALDALFSLAVSPRGRMIRPELYEESIQVAGYTVSDYAAYLERCKEADYRLGIFLKDFSPEAKASGKYTVYPANDYMALAVKAQGVNYKRFKYLVGER